MCFKGLNLTYEGRAEEPRALQGRRCLDIYGRGLEPSPSQRKRSAQPLCVTASMPTLLSRLDGGKNHERYKAQSLPEFLLARQPFPTAWGGERGAEKDSVVLEGNEKKRKGEAKEIKSQAKAATYRDLSWQLSRKAPRLQCSAFS